MAPISNEAAMRKVRSLALSLGVECRPVVLADRSNLVLHLQPHSIVARVAMATSMVRDGVSWLRREVELTRYLDERGGSVTRPTANIDPGPFESEGLIVSFWELERLGGTLADARAAGRELANAHRLLREYPTRELEPWGAWAEASAVFDRARKSAAFSAEEWRRVEAAWYVAERIVASAAERSRSFQIVHGDAHLGNVLYTSRGPLWTDWEDAFLGPVEYDIACLRSRAELFGEDGAAIAAACAGYDGEHEPELVVELGLVRNVQVILWLAVFAERDPSLLGRMRARIERLPEAP